MIDAQTLNLQVAVKVDKKTEVKSLNREIQILKRLQKKQYFCKMLDYGRLDDGRSFCVMELLGGNLAKLQQFEILGWRDRLLASKELLMGIKELHVSGYIHRDIKPANIALRSTCNAGQSKWALFDFGLGRKIIGTDGVVFKERTGIGFRGSVSYASVNAHDEKDLSFHDDLWSWMYILVELLTGMHLENTIHDKIKGFIRILYIYLNFRNPALEIPTPKRRNQ